MNYCTKCASYYQQPGTCNCYAPSQGTTTVTPWVPKEPNPWLPDLYPTTAAPPSNPYGTTTNPYPTTSGGASGVPSGIVYYTPGQIEQMYADGILSYT